MQNEAQEIEINIEQAKKQIQLRNCLMRLQENKDFKTVFNEQYFKDEPARLVALKADYNMQEDKDQKEIDRQMLGVAYCKNYLRTIYQLGLMADKSLEDDEETRQQILEEDL